MVSVGTIVWLSSELMFFAGLFAVYFTVRAQTEGEWPPPPTELDIVYARSSRSSWWRRRSPASSACSPPSAATSSGCAAGTCVSSAWALFFVLGQANEYHTLVTEHDTTISSSAYGTVFYLTTGFHGLHVIGGLIAFIFC